MTGFLYFREAHLTKGAFVWLDIEMGLHVRRQSRGLVERLA